MLVPLSWLKEYVPLPADTAALLERLTLAGLPATGARVFGLPVPSGLRVKPEDAGIVWERDKLLVAKVLEITKHPNADTLKLVRLDLGGSEKTVITGAENIAPGQSGMKIVLGLRGSRYFFEGKDGKKTVMTLEPKALRGIDNDAMCMSDFELGIAEDSEGIIILDDTDPAPGTPLQDVLGEVVVSFDVPPNMARCHSLIGIAREVAALTGAVVKTPETKLETAAEKIDGKVLVEVADKHLCSRYTATIIRNVTVKPAPRWMRSRLHYTGITPVNNVADIVNYVTLETGQPLFAFDFDVLLKRAGGSAPTLTVRPAKAGEKLKTLDGQDRALTPENLVIADAVGPIALAGVIGGSETAVTAATKTVLLESACFGASRTHPAQAKPAAERAAQLLREFANGEVLAGIIDVYPAPLPPQVIDLDATEISRVLGFDIAAEEVVLILTALQFQVEPDGDDAWTVTTPLTRLDILSAADLIEEVARVYGYDKLPSRRMPFELPEPKASEFELEDRLRDVLIACGLQEAITSDGSQAALREGLLAVAKSNLEHTDSVSFFEIGTGEPRRLALVLCGRRGSRAWDDPQSSAPQFNFYDIKGVLEAITADLHIPNVSFAATQGVPWLHPMRAAELRVNSNAIGVFGELHPKVAPGLGLTDRAVQIADLDLGALLTAIPGRVTYKPFSAQPVAKREVAVLVPEATTVDAVLAEIRTAAGDLLADATLAAVERGLTDGMKGLAFALTYQAPDRALSEKEVAKAHEKVEGRLKHVLKAQIRNPNAT